MARRHTARRDQGRLFFCETGPGSRRRARLRERHRRERRQVPRERARLHEAARGVRLRPLGAKGGGDGDAVSVDWRAAHLAHEEVVAWVSGGVDGMAAAAAAAAMGV